MLRLTRKFTQRIPSPPGLYWETFSRFVYKCANSTKFNSIRSKHIGIMEGILGVTDIPVNTELDLCERGKLLC